MSESKRPQKTILSTILALVAAAAAWWFGAGKNDGENAKNEGATKEVAAPLARRGLEKISRAFRNRQSDVLIEGEARVKFTLPDDNEGSRHQKWVCEFPGSPLTVLFSHNIDLAPYVPLQKGDTIQFFGEYEYTDKGGVIHWTHHDPGGRHPDGWIRHKGETYQ